MITAIKHLLIIKHCLNFLRLTKTSLMAIGQDNPHMKYIYEIIHICTAVVDECEE